MYVRLGHYAVQEKLGQYCKPTILKNKIQIKKKKKKKKKKDVERLQHLKYCQ